MDPRTTQRYNRRRRQLDDHPAYSPAAKLAARHRMGNLMTDFEERTESLELIQSAALSWRCYHCGAVGDDAAGINAASHVVGEMEMGEGPRVFLRPYCGACLPAPAGRQDPAADAWQAYNATSGQLTRALWVAADEGEVDATDAYHYQCPACGTRTVEDLTARQPVFAVAADREEAACISCVESLPDAALADADRRRIEGARPAWTV
ncbi:hypothetical protein [Streptomyces qinglanensis]|uniref:hypothetical protein n=1 Tax=Streptomyces qinglanensis TaxID=943816 RepID=UPI003D706528